MLNFEFYNPTHILFGKDSVEKIDQQVPKNANVLILFGGESAKKNGTLDEVKNSLKLRSVFEFGGIEANPTYETMLKAVEYVKQNKIDFLLAVGGGSVIDATKFLAAAVLLEGEEPWEILEQHGNNVKNALPFGTVLTLPATGSEMNGASVITRTSIKKKSVFISPHVFPKFSVLDPTKTYSLPARQLENGIADAFAHVIEQYLTYPVNAMIQDRFAEGLLKTLIEVAPQIVNKPVEYESRANMMWAAAMALNGLIGAGVPQDWSTHLISHELTALCGIDHARTLSIILPSLLEHCRVEKKDKLLQYAQKVWNIKEGTDNEKITQAINKTREFFESLNIKTKLSDYNLDEDSITQVIEQLKAHGMMKLGEHQNITPEIVVQILQRSL